MYDDNRYTKPVAIEHDIVTVQEDTRTPQSWPAALPGEVEKEYICALRDDCPANIVHFSFTTVVVQAPKFLIPAEASEMGNEGKRYQLKQMRYLITPSQAEAVRERAKLTPIYRRDTVRWVSDPESEDGRRPENLPELRGFADKYLILEPVESARKAEPLKPITLNPKKSEDLATMATDAMIQANTGKDPKNRTGRTRCAATTEKGTDCKNFANGSEKFCKKHGETHTAMDPENGDTRRANKT